MGTRGKNEKHRSISVFLPKLILVTICMSWKFQLIHCVGQWTMQRLGSGEWFTARVSACGLFHIAYPSASESLQTELRAVYNQLCHDDLPMVRRSAASNLGKFAATDEPSYLKSEILSFFRDLTQDGTFCSHDCPF